MTANVESAFVDIVKSNFLTSANCIEYLYQNCSSTLMTTVFYYSFLNGDIVAYLSLWILLQLARKRKVDNMSMAATIYL